MPEEQESGIAGVDYANPCPQCCSDHTELMPDNLSYCNDCGHHFDTIVSGFSNDKIMRFPNYEMMWLDLQLNISGNALANTIKQNQAKTDTLTEIKHLMEHMEQDKMYLTAIPMVDQILSAQNQRKGGLRAISWFSWNFRHFHRNEGLEWEDAFRKAIFKTMDQLDEQYEKDLQEKVGV